MKKNKTFFGIIAAVLSAIILVGCGGGATAVGKKYDAIYTAVDDYAIALDGLQTYLYNKDKKVGKDGYYSIELISNAYSDYFKAKKSADSENYILLKNDGTAKEISAEVSGIATGLYYDYVQNNDGVTDTLNTVGFRGTLKDGAQGGRYAIINTDGNIIAKADSVNYIGGGVFSLTHSAKDGNEATVSIVNASGTTLVESTPISEIEIDKFNADASSSSSKLNTVNGVNVFTVTKDGETSVYGVNGLIEKGVNVFAGSKNRVYEKDGEFYALDESLNKVKLGYKIDEYLSYADGKHYVSESNGQSGDSERFRVREVFGDADEYWFDVLVKSGTTSVPYFIGTEGDETGYAPRSVIYNNKMQSVFTSNEITAIRNSTNNVKYNQYNDGFACIANTETGVRGEVSYGSKGITCKPASDERVTLYSGVYALFTSIDGKRLFTPAMSEPVAIDAAKSLLAGTVYRINGLPVIADDVKYFDGSVSSPAVIDPRFGNTIEDYTVNASGGGNVVSRKENYDLLDAEAREKVANYTVQIRLAVFTWDDNGTEKSESYLLYRKYGSGAMYEKIRLGDGKAVLKSSGVSGVALIERENCRDYYKAVTDADGKVSLEFIGCFGTVSSAVKDAYGNIYIVESVNGKTAVYSESGELLLEPRYSVDYDMKNNIAEYKIANGIVVVRNGDYCGIVKLGKTAKKAKLIKKIEYEFCELFSTGDFALGKAGDNFTLYDASGKKVVGNLTGSSRTAGQSRAYSSAKLYAAKANDRERVNKMIVTLSDGKECVITRSVKQKDLDWSITNVLF